MGEIDKNASKHLGQKGSYAITTDKFDSTLLVKMPRQEAREQWNIDEDSFVGVDVWRAYESTFLLDSGLPIAGTLKIVCSAHSEYMVESKSLKLYLNSFDMCKMGHSVQGAIDNYKAQIKEDLDNLLETDIKIGFFSSVLDLRGNLVETAFHVDDFGLVDAIGSNMEDVIDDYREERDHLRYGIKTLNEEFGIFKYGEAYYNARYRSDLLRSRCRHTNQKDSGSVYVEMRANRKLIPKSLLKQIISLREVNEFHEFCGEKLFMSILKSNKISEHSSTDVKFKDLMVGCLYARRGGIDINPIRATSWDLIPEDLLSEHKLTNKTLMQ